MKANVSLYELGINFDSYLKQDVYETLVSDSSVKEKYEELKKNGATVSIHFDVASRDGDLFAYEDDWRIVLRNKDIYGRKYDRRSRSRMINRSYSVTVREIDEDGKCIYVSHISAKQQDREKLRGILDKEDGVRVPAKVVMVRMGSILVDIGGLGIPGYIPIREWSPCYTVNLYAHAKRGDVIEVAVVGKGDMSKEEIEKNFSNWSDQEPYMCSRRVLVKDPWIGISQKLHREDVIVVTCEVKEEKCFFGVTKDFPELNIYCFYPDAENDKNRLEIIPGCSYECWIKHIDEDKKILRAKPFRMIDAKPKEGGK